MRRPTARFAPLFGALAVLSGSIATANAASVVIHTGGENGAYHGSFCPALKEKLKADGVTAECRASDGTSQNMSRIADGPADMGYGQLDVLALEAKNFGGPQVFERVRVDDVRECLFVVSKNKQISNFGEVAYRAADLRVILPPASSGSAATFRYLQNIDPYGLGRARDITHANNADDAIRKALESDDGITLFVQFPDPDNARFKLIQELGGHIVPVIDRNLLAQRMENRPVYYPQKTQVTNAGWLKSGTQVVTACTPLVLFTGARDSLAEDAARKQHNYLIDIIKRYPADQLLPKQSIFANVLRRTRELSSVGAEKFVQFSDDARERLTPLIEKAKEAAAEAVDAAKPKTPADEQPGSEKPPAE